MYWEQAALHKEETLDCGTMPIEKFIDGINNEEIPLSAPEGSCTGGWHLNCEDLLKTFQARKRCNELGMWAIVFHEWVKELAKWIEHRQCLEIMAGAGWLAKALKQCDIYIIATDDFSWQKNQHAKIVPVFPISNYEASEAILNINADILIVSSPPYFCNAIVKACEVWGSEKPIIKEKTKEVVMRQMLFLTASKSFKIILISTEAQINRYFSAQGECPSS